MELKLLASSEGDDAYKLHSEIQPPRKNSPSCRLLDSKVLTNFVFSLPYHRNRKLKGSHTLKNRPSWSRPSEALACLRLEEQTRAS